MSITHQAQVIADVKVSHVHLRRGVGFYQLRFSVAFGVIPRTDAQLRFEQATLKVLVGASSNPQEFLGTALPEFPLFIATKSSPLSFSTLFEMPLSPAQLSRIEELRNGGDLHFKLTLYGETFGPNEPTLAHDEMTFVASQSDWIKRLSEARYTDSLVFEISIPPQSEAGTLRTALGHLHKARELFLVGHYNEAVARCRSVLEAMAAVAGEEKRQSQVT